MGLLDPTPREPFRFAATASALVLSTSFFATPAAAAECQFAPLTSISHDSGFEPLLLIDGKCTDPAYNEKTFVIEKTEQLTFQVLGGPLIPYTQVTGHFPATNTYATLKPPIRSSPTLNQQGYVFRFPDKAFWRNRSMLQQHPTGGGKVDDQLAFTNGAHSIQWTSAGSGNSAHSHRHQAAATLIAAAYARRHYGTAPNAKIWNYAWGCSGGGIVGMAMAENTTGVWDGVQPQCMAPSGIGNYHSFMWQAMYTAAIPQAKRDAIAAAAAPGGSGDIYAGLNPEEKVALTEFISAGYPLAAIGNHFKGLDLPLVDPVGIRMSDPAYENDFWSKPGYAGSNPPNWVKAALIDGWATISGITRDAQGNVTALQFDPATIPPAGTIGDAYLEFWTYAPDGKTRLIDPDRPLGVSDRRRYSLMGPFDRATGTKTLTGTTPQRWGPPLPITQSPALMNGLKVGDKVRINNRFILSMYFYPRHSNLPGQRSYDQYRNANGSAKYPQREDVSILSRSNYGTMGGRIETGAVKTKTIIMEGMGDNLSWPIFNSSYAEMIQRTLGPAKAEEMMRFYLHDNGNHSIGGGLPGVFRQSVHDLMDWAEKGIVPPPSVRYTLRDGQIVAAPRAADRGGLQPVMELTANGSPRAVVRVNQPVQLAARVEMPPRSGRVVQYFWTVAGTPDAPTDFATPPTSTGIERTVAFHKPGTYVVRLTVNGQRDGQLNPPDRTLLENYREVQVVVGDSSAGGGERGK